MRRWAPWLLAFVVWNGTFDLQVRRAGAAFTADQLDRWRSGQPPLLIRDAFLPAVNRSAWISSAASASVLVLVAVVARRRGRGAASVVR